MITPAAADYVAEQLHDLARAYAQLAEHLTTASPLRARQQHDGGGRSRGAHLTVPIDLGLSDFLVGSYTDHHAETWPGLTATLREAERHWRPYVEACIAVLPDPAEKAYEQVRLLTPYPRPRPAGWDGTGVDQRVIDVAHWLAACLADARYVGDDLAWEWLERAVNRLTGRCQALLGGRRAAAAPVVDLSHLPPADLGRAAAGRRLHQPELRRHLRR